MFHSMFLMLTCEEGLTAQEPSNVESAGLTMTGGVAKSVDGAVAWLCAAGEEVVEGFPAAAGDDVVVHVVFWGVVECFQGSGC